MREALADSSRAARFHEVSLRWLLGCFVILAGVYGVVNPIFEAPDEVQHFFVVQHIAQTGSLPVQDPAHVALYRQEGSQPPLYYLLGAALTFWIDTRDAADRARENPHVSLGVPQAFGNKNAVVHTSAERFPYRGTTLAVHLLRLLSAVLGAVTVWATYRLGREVFPRRPDVALLAAITNAFIPQFLFMAGAVSNDIAVAATASWTAVIWARGLRDGFDLRRSVLLGIGVGLSALSKLSGLGVVPLVVLGLVYWGWRERAGRPATRSALTVLIVAALVGGWWYLRNWVHYGDPLGLRTMLDVAGRRETFGWADLLSELEGLRISFWGLFGWFNVLMAQWTYYLFDALAVIGFLGLCVLLWREAHFQKRDYRVIITLLGLVLWIVIVLGALFRWTWATTGSQGRLVFAVMSGLCVLWAGGIGELTPRRGGRLVLAGFAAVLFVIAASAPFLYIAPAYARPAIISVARLPQAMKRLDVTFGGKMKLLGYDLPESRVKRGTPLRLTLYWQSLVAMERDYTVFVHLFGRESKAVGQEDTYPGGGNCPTSQWQPGDVIRDEYEVLVAPEAKAPAVGRLDVGLYDLDTKERLTAYDRDMHPLERVMLDPVKLLTWASHRYQVDNAVHFELGSDIWLVGYRVDEAGAKAGQPLKVALYWEARAVPTEDYTVFVHLVDPAGKLVAQHDSQPMGGDYPTSFWEVGETVKDEHEINMPAGLAAGEYRLQVGMYRMVDGQRLAVRDAGGQSTGDIIPLPKVRLEGSK